MKIANIFGVRSAMERVKEFAGGAEMADVFDSTGKRVGFVVAFRRAEGLGFFSATVRDEGARWAGDGGAFSRGMDELDFDMPPVHELERVAGALGRLGVGLTLNPDDGAFGLYARVGIAGERFAHCRVAAAAALLADRWRLELRELTADRVGFQGQGFPYNGDDEESAISVRRWRLMAFALAARLWIKPLPVDHPLFN